jgi:hypothetical protein
MEPKSSPMPEVHEVVDLRLARARASRQRRADKISTFFDTLGRHSKTTVVLTWLVAWPVVRLALCSVLVLMEPLVRIILVPVAFLGFLVTLVFGFVAGDPTFPKWGMLAFSVASLWLYWLFLGLMALLMRLP